MGPVLRAGKSAARVLGVEVGWLGAMVPLRLYVATIILLCVAYAAMILFLFCFVTKP